METVTLSMADQKGRGIEILDDVIEKLDQWQDIYIFFLVKNVLGVIHG